MSAAKRMGATVVAITENSEGLDSVSHIVEIPAVTNELFAPMVYIIPVQFLAYYLAMEKGLNCDDPEGFDIVLDIILEPGRAEPEMRKTK